MAFHSTGIIDEINSPSDKKSFSEDDRSEIALSVARTSSLLDGELPLNEPAPANIRIMTLNAHGPTSPPEKSATAKMRKALLREIIVSTYPEILFLQEVKWVNFPQHVPIKVGGHTYKYFGTVNEAGILHHPDIEMAQIEITKDDWNQTMKGYEKQQHRVTVGEVTPNRIFSYIPPFIVLSFHGIHKGTSKLKNDMCYKLIDLCKEIGKQKNLPVVIGGDWNCDLSELELPELCVLPMPEGNRHFDPCIDWLCLVPPPPPSKFSLGKVQTLDFYQENGHFNSNSLTELH